MIILSNCEGLWRECSEKCPIRDGKIFLCDICYDDMIENYKNGVRE